MASRTGYFPFFRRLGLAVKRGIGDALGTLNLPPQIHESVYCMCTNGATIAVATTKMKTNTATTSVRATTDARCLLIWPPVMRSPHTESKETNQAKIRKLSLTAGSQIVIVPQTSASNSNKITNASFNRTPSDLQIGSKHRWKNVCPMARWNRPLFAGQTILKMDTYCSNGAKQQTRRQSQRDQWTAPSKTRHFKSLAVFIHCAHHHSMRRGDCFFWSQAECRTVPPDAKL